MFAVDCSVCMYSCTMFYLSFFCFSLKWDVGMIYCVFMGQYFGSSAFGKPNDS